MKAFRYAGWTAFLSLLPACSFHAKPTVVQPVGPAPAEASVNTTTAPHGYLIVYTAWSSFVDPGSVGHHSRYTISADDGSASKEVINHLDRFDEGPIRLALTPGAYHVTARAARAGRVVVPVVIKQRETTYVYLDGSSHPRARSDQEQDVVKLPNGQIVGWAANAGAKGSN